MNIDVRINTIEDPTFAVQIKQEIDAVLRCLANRPDTWVTWHTTTTTYDSYNAAPLQLPKN